MSDETAKHLKAVFEKEEAKPKVDGTALNLNQLLNIVENVSNEALRREFIPNLMVTGTPEYEAIECGIRIGRRFRSQVELIIAPDVEMIDGSN